jgi:hypothetical protein
MQIITVNHICHRIHRIQSHTMFILAKSDTSPSLVAFLTDWLETHYLFPFTHLLLAVHPSACHQYPPPLVHFTDASLTLVITLLLVQ